MNISASQQLEEPTTALIITNWLIVKDINGERFLHYEDIVIIIRMVGVSFYETKI